MSRAPRWGSANFLPPRAHANELSAGVFPRNEIFRADKARHLAASVVDSGREKGTESLHENVPLHAGARISLAGCAAGERGSSERQNGRRRRRERARHATTSPAKL